MSNYSYRFSITDYRSSRKNLAYSFFASRERHRQRCDSLRSQLERAEKRNQRLVNENRRLKQLLRSAKAADNEPVTAKETTTRLADDPPLKGHHFGARTIAMCCELCKHIGFRAAERVLPVIRQWLGVNLKLPKRGAMRSWCCRHGIGILEQSKRPADDWIWMIDHHVPIGNMVALVILGIRQSQLPVDRPLRRDDMKPLAIVCGTSRRKENVEQALVDLAEQIGAPISIVVDGASELHEGIKALKNKGFEVVLQDDIKHKAANILKKLLRRDPRFKEFESHFGKTTANIQQTELDHFLPPKKRTKCRFMNFGRLIDWADMIQHHHRDPNAPGHQGVSRERFEDKLGWVKEYEQDLREWRECRNIISLVLEFTNRRGVHRGSTEELKEALLPVSLTSDLSRKVFEQLLACCQANEHKLLDSRHCSLRLVCSTEILESSLGAYKQLQRNHQRGTFTSLLAVFPTLFSTTDAKSVHQTLTQVSNKNLMSWLKDSGLTNSTQTRRMAAYRAALG